MFTTTWSGHSTGLPEDGMYASDSDSEEEDEDDEDSNGASFLSVMYACDCSS